MGGTLWVESQGFIGGNPSLRWQRGKLSTKAKNRKQGFQTSTEFQFSGFSSGKVESLSEEFLVPPYSSQGSTFYFTITTQVATAPEQAEFSTSLVPLAGKRLLIVDDNLTNREILSLQAESWKMQTYAAKSGKEALAQLAKGTQFDIAILDMQMPEMDGLNLARQIRQQSGYQNLPLVILTSLGRGGTFSDFGNVQFAASLSKPIKQSQLYDVVTHVLGNRPIQASIFHSHSSLVDRHLAHRLPLRILLAEDTVVNQKVALLMLQKIGYQADVVTNGLEVLKALQKQPFDVVLMDVHMPEMDGLETTRRICQEWKVGFRPYIIAITANAMRGDREACFATGMDDYISKPVQLEELTQALSKCPPQKSFEFTFIEKQSKGICLELQPSQNILQEGQNQTLNIAKIDPKTIQFLRDVVTKDHLAFAELLQCYLTEASRQVQDISVAITTQDAQTLWKTAHQLKSSSGSVGAIALAQLCKKLEAQGYSNKLENSLELLSQLHQEYEQVQTALQKEFAKEA
nr:response regulator [Nostoc sp. WHI]